MWDLLLEGRIYGWDEQSDNEYIVWNRQRCSGVGCLSSSLVSLKEPAFEHLPHREQIMTL